MDIYASDEEKGEAIKQWWRDNGTSVILGLVVASAIFVGGRYWLGEKQVQTANAAKQYQYIEVLLTEEKQAEAEKVADTLFSDYAATPYATFSAFSLAKSAAENQEYDKSTFYLEWIVNHAQLEAHIETARFRLAKLLFNEGAYQQASSLCDQSNSIAFKSLFDELKADILLAQGEKTKAESLLQSVISGLDSNDPRYMIVKLKLDDVSGV